MKRNCSICNSEFSTCAYQLKRGYGKYCSSKCYGKSLIGRKEKPEMTKRRLAWIKTAKRTESWCKNIAASKAGDKSHFWKGGITEEARIIRGSTKYRWWRKSVMDRDGHKCLECGAASNLQADHILAFSDYPNDRFKIENGRTLCIECHKKTPNYGNEYARKKRAVVR